MTGKMLLGWQWELLDEIIAHLRDNPPAPGTSTRVKNERKSNGKATIRRENYLRETDRLEGTKHETPA